MARYPFPWDLFVSLGGDLLRHPRLLSADARLMAARIEPAPEVRGSDNIPPDGPLVVLANHYQRRGLWIGWPGVVVTEKIRERRGQEPPIRWLTTGGLRLFQWRDQGPEIPLTPALLRAVARVYGMTALPLSGPSARAAALREWMRYLDDGDALGVFPEGVRGSSTGLRVPEQGFSTLCRLLARRARLLPVGIFEAHGTLTITFGPALTLDRSRDPAGDVMNAMGALLPPGLRGPFAPPARSHGALD